MHRGLHRGMLVACLVARMLWCAAGQGQQPAKSPAFPGLTSDMGSLFRLSDAQSRSISPENFTGEKGKAGMATEGTGKSCARELGQG